MLIKVRGDKGKDRLGLPIFNVVGEFDLAFKFQMYVVEKSQVKLLPDHVRVTLG